MSTATAVAIVAAVLTTPEAAAYLRIKPTTLEQQRWRGEGPRYLKLGRSVRYRRDDLDRYMDSRSRTSTSDQGTSL